MGKPPSALNIHTDDQDVLPVLITKFWSAVVHSKLSGHVADITGKIARGISVITKTREYLNRESLLRLYYSFCLFLLVCDYITTMHIGSCCKNSYLNFARLTKTHFKNNFWGQN